MFMVSLMFGRRHLRTDPYRDGSPSFAALFSADEIPTYGLPVFTVDLLVGLRTI